jgi:hypothetical protein
MVFLATVGGWLFIFNPSLRADLVSKSRKIMDKLSL